MSSSINKPPTAERFIEATLDLVAENGGSLGVNLRQIARRVGCAHTNVYNYYPSYEALLWDAFRRALRIYGEALTEELSVDLQPREYLTRLVSNLASFPEEQTGLYRLIGSDPIDVERVPEDILETVTHMKVWMSRVFMTASSNLAEDAARDAADIVLAYVDGETLNLINGRVIPDEHLRDRIVGNAMHLFDVLTPDEGAKISPRKLPEPTEIFPEGWTA